MNIELLSERLEVALRRADALRRRVRARRLPDSEMLAETLTELEISLEELRVAEKELRKQNEELAIMTEELEVERRRYQHLFEFAPDGYLVTDAAGRVLEANHAAGDLLGMDARLLSNRSLSAFFLSEEARTFASWLDCLRKDDAVRTWETRLHPHVGPPFDASLSVSATHDTTGKRVSLRWIVRDITERKQAESRTRALNDELERRVQERTAELEAANRHKDILLAGEQAMRRRLQQAHTALQKSEARLRCLVDSNLLGVTIGKIGGRIAEANDGFLLMVSYTREEMQAGQVSWKAITPQECHYLDEWANLEMQAKGTCAPYETELIRKDGTRVPVLIGIALFDKTQQDGITFYLDLTQAKQTEHQIEELNARLQRAMVETHHRVKNNLQIIVGMIDMLLADSPTTIPAAEVRRLSAYALTMAAVHDTLTQATKKDGEAQFISAREILERLLTMLRETTPSRHLHFRLKEARLSAKQAISLALVVNELVSNALKYGEGEIEVIFSVHDNFAVLEICDDGPGFPPEFDVVKAAHTGIELVENLIRLDLDGQVSYENRAETGTRVRVTFFLSA